MPSERALAHISRPARLPVWPIASGVFCWAAETVGLRSLAGSVENRFGGRVTPMSLPIEASDPFLMLVHHRHTFSRWDPVRPFSALVMPEGFPAHPHRGFETVTFVLEGGMRHRDSTGVKMEYRSGSVQWLTAGRGVLHEEMWATNEGTHELYQIWVNLPKAHKWDAPQIQLLGPAEVTSESDILHAPLPVAAFAGVSLTVLAGACRGVCSPIRTRSPMTLVRLQWDDAGDFLWDDLPAHHTALCFVRRGSVTVGERTMAAGELGHFERSSATRLKLCATTGTDVLLLTGAPLREPVAMGGSMVMNTPSEVDQANRDFQLGKFGNPWPHTATDEEWRAAIADRKLLY